MLTYMAATLRLRRRGGKHALELVEHVLLAVADAHRVPAHEAALLGRLGGALGALQQPLREALGLLRRGLRRDDGADAGELVEDLLAGQGGVGLEALRGVLALRGHGLDGLGDLAGEVPARGVRRLADDLDDGARLLDDLDRPAGVGEGDRHPGHERCADDPGPLLVAEVHFPGHGPTLPAVGHHAGARLPSAFTSVQERKEPDLLVGRWMEMLRRGAVLATAFSALLAAPAAASLDVTVPLDGSLRSLDPSPTAFNFGAWPVGSTSGAQTFTFTFNGSSESSTDITAIGTVGGNTKDFQVLAPGSEGDCFVGESLFDGSSCTVNVEFAPKAGGVRTTTLRVTDDRGEQGNVSLFGTGAVPSVSPSSLSFGNQPVGITSPVQQVT